MPLIDYSNTRHQFEYTVHPMNRDISFADILDNTINKDYTDAQAVDDLEKLMNESTQLEIQHEQNSPRFMELQKLIPVQERLMQAKLGENPIFNRIGSLEVIAHQDD